MKKSMYQLIYNIDHFFFLSNQGPRFRGKRSRVRFRDTSLRDVCMRQMEVFTAACRYADGVHEEKGDTIFEAGIHAVFSCAIRLITPGFFAATDKSQPHQ
jgi:hypothetical protein